MRKRSNLILTLFLMILLSGCNNISKDIETFENLINNDNYQKAFTIYEENKENDEFLKATAVSVNDIIEGVKESFNNEKYNIDEAKANIDNIKKFITDNTYNQTVKYLNELHESKNNLINAQEKEKLLDYETAIMYYEKVIESDINYSVAKENIDIINEKVAESYKQIVISMKDKVQVEIDDIENFYIITYDFKQTGDILLKEPYAGITTLGIEGELEKENSAFFEILIQQLIPTIAGKFTEVIFYQETTDNVIFDEKDMPLQESIHVGWANMYGSSEMTRLFFNTIISNHNNNEEKFGLINDKLNNVDSELIIRIYFSDGTNIDLSLTNEEKNIIKEMYNLYNALKYDNNLVNELI